MNALKKLFSDTVLYGLSSVLARLIGYLLVPYFTDVFLPDEYGKISIIFVLLGIFNVLYTWGMESAFLKIGSKNKGAQLKDAYNTLFLSLIGQSLLLSAVLWGSSFFWMPAAGLGELSNEVLWMMLGILSADTLSVLGFAALRLQGRAALFAGLKLSQVALNALLSVWFIESFDMGIRGVFMANLCSSAYAFLGVKLIHLPLIRIQWDKDIYKRALQFGLPFIPAGLGHLVNEGFDRFFLLRMDEARIQEWYGEAWSGDDLVGIYSACYKLAVFILLLVQMFRMAWQPFFLEQSEKEGAKEVFSKVFLLVNAVLVLAWITIGLFAKEIAAITIPGTSVTIIGSAYWAGLHVVPILLAAYVFQGWYVVFTVSAFVGNKSSILAKVTGMGALITLGGNFLFTPIYGMEAAALVTVTSYASMSVLLWYLGKAHYAIEYDFVRAVSSLLIAIGAFSTYHYYPSTNEMIVKGSILLIAAFAIMITLVPGDPTGLRKSILGR